MRVYQGCENTSCISLHLTLAGGSAAGIDMIVALVGQPVHEVTTFRPFRPWPSTMGGAVIFTIAFKIKPLYLKYKGCYLTSNTTMVAKQ